MYFPSALITGIFDTPFPPAKGLPGAWLTNEMAPELPSHKKICRLDDDAPGTRFVAKLANETHRPSSLMNGIPPSPSPPNGAGPLVAETSAKPPVCRSYRKSLRCLVVAVV